MRNARMPFPRVTCSVWLPIYGEPDVYGNRAITYGETADVEVQCCYAPGSAMALTSDETTADAPSADTERIYLFLPKTFEQDLRDAVFEVDGIDNRRFAVVGDPHSYMREATPGDMSWYVEGVLRLGQ